MVHFIGRPFEECQEQDDFHSKFISVHSCRPHIRKNKHQISNTERSMSYSGLVAFDHISVFHLPGPYRSGIDSPRWSKCDCGPPRSSIMDLRSRSEPSAFAHFVPTWIILTLYTSDLAHFVPSLLPDHSSTAPSTYIAAFANCSQHHWVTRFTFSWTCLLVFRWKWVTLANHWGWRATNGRLMGPL